jgi:hypothetical protein
MSGPRYRPTLAIVIAFGALVAPLIAGGPGATQTTPSDPERVLSERFQFSPEDVTLARSGQPVARMIAGAVRDELAVVGALRLDGDKKRLVDWIRNIQQFRHAAELGLTRAIGSPPAVEAFADLALDAKDLAALQACRPGRCDLRLSDEAMTKFQSGVPWGTPDAAARANAQAAGMLVGYAQAYLRGGDQALGNDFGQLLRGATALYELAPELAAYLERFPASTLAGVDQRLYWTNMTEGSESIISLHHQVVYRRPSGDVIIADKTIYASRYFDVAALVLSMQETVDGKGYYLIAGSRARSSKLTGLTGRVLRGQVERSAVSTVKMYLEWVRDSLAAH